MQKIRVALVGVGNCASSLVQGVSYYADPARGNVGLIHDYIGDYGPADLEFVLAFDTDARKVGLDLAEAIFAPPNCTAVFERDIATTGVTVRMGRVLDGMADHMTNRGERGFVRSEAPEESAGKIVAAQAEVIIEVIVIIVLHIRSILHLRSILSRLLTIIWSEKYIIKITLTKLLPR